MSLAQDPPAAVATITGENVWEPFPDGSGEGDGEGPAQATNETLRWPGSVWMSGTRQVRFGTPEAVLAAAERSRWLSDWFPAAAIDHADEEWLVTQTSGHPAHRPDLQPVPDDLPALVGRSLRRLHNLDIGSCAFAADWEVQHHAIAAAVEGGCLDVSALPSPYDRYEPERLLELLVEGRPDRAETVVCHGAPVLANLWFAQGQLQATTGHHRLGLGDPYLDLAIAHRSVQAWFGGEAVFGFYQGYGIDPDLIRLDHYVLVDVLSSAARSQPETGL